MNTTDKQTIPLINNHIGNIGRNENLPSGKCLGQIH